MTIYQVESRAGSIAVSVILGAMSLGLVVLGAALPGQRSNLEPGVAWLLAAFVWVLALGFLLGSLLCLAEVHQIGMTDDGTIEFRRIRGVTKLKAQDLYFFEGMYDTDLGWRLHIRAKGLYLDCGQFDGMLEFVGAVQRHNPAVEITGSWPMGSPDRLSSPA